MRVGVPILAILLLAAAAPLSQQEPPSQLIVAYMTSDGALVPIARRDGAVWRNTWPEPILNDAPLPVRTVSAIPRAWLGQRVPATWTVWSQATRQQHAVTVTGLGRDGACVEAITLTTSLKAPLRSEGLAFDRPIAVEEITVLEEGSPQGDVWRREIAPHFRAAIAARAVPQADDDQRRLGAKAFAAARPETLADGTILIETILRHARLPVFYIEAERHFSGISTDTDYDALSYSGWFRRNAAGALTPISAAVAAFSTARGKLP